MPQCFATRSTVQSASVVAAIPIAWPANDNDVSQAGTALLRSALRIFAQRGVNSASHASSKAESAFFSDDAAAFRWWTGITRMLDRMALAENRAEVPDARVAQA
jgi:hypothetical protein